MTDRPRETVFLLSPATAHGKKGRRLLDHPPRTPTARALHGEGMPIGSLFRYLSGLYFNGKLAYAQMFARPPANVAGVHILTMTDGLVTRDWLVTVRDLERFVGAELGSDAGRIALVQSCRDLAARIGEHCDIVFVGSVAGEKYTAMLEPVFGERLLFPGELLGRGQLERGAILLECVLDERELEYAPLTALRGIAKQRQVRRARKGVGSDAGHPDAVHAT